LKENFTKSLKLFFSLGRSTVRMIRDEPISYLSMRALYLDDCYKREFRSTVEDAAGERIILDETAFYPRSGGQPSDQGFLLRGDEEFRVLQVEPSGGRIVHIVDRAGLQPGDSIHAALDWERRHHLMRSHTACHILSAVIFQETGAKITGNQIDLTSSRVDFSLESFDKARMGEYVEMANRIAKEDHSVVIGTLTRAEALALPDLVRLDKDLPESEAIRVVKIEGVDMQACGGTHVLGTGEIGMIKMIKAENKGRANRRVYFALED
jgi:misacylated tRNA(Ala) deacylase